MTLETCITLDLEADHAGRTSESFISWKEDNIKKLIKILNKYKAPLTIFVVANTLKINTKAIKQLLVENVEFFLHSYSHKIQESDTLEEIRLGKEAYKDFFGRYPTGYRAPEGRISEKGLKHLAKEGFVFDASILPSFWPHPRYLKYPQKPFKPLKKYNLVEIPFTTISPLRLPLSLSWIKLIGLNIYQYWFGKNSLPKLIIFSFHLHDLWSSPSYHQLSPFWKLIYKRNQHKGLEIFETILKTLTSKGYAFTNISRVINATNIYHNVAY